VGEPPRGAEEAVVVMRLGPYEIVSEIGRGGMGVVYRARSPEGRDVAVKLLLEASDRLAVERFARERRLLASFGEAEGFVPLLDAGEVREGPFLVMPFLTGGTLRARLEEGLLPADEAVALVAKLARALGGAHARGIVHRDLKPENVLFDAASRPLVADLGLAKHFRRDVSGASQSRALTEAGAIGGTIGYAAPEQIDDATTAGPAADVFALGAILHECLSGRKPFEATSLVRYVKAIEAGSPAPVEAARWIARVVERALARDPAERFADGLALARALEAGAPAGAGRLAIGGAVLTAAIGGAVAIAASRGGARQGAAPGGDAAAVASTSLAPALRLAKSAEQKLKTGDLDAALAEATRAIELDPKLILGFAVRAEVRVRRRDYVGAADDCTHAIALDPNLPNGYWNRGLIEETTEDLNAALADFSKVIEFGPPYARVLGHRSSVRWRLGDRAGAIADCERCLELAPDAPESAEIRRNLEHMKATEPRETEPKDAQGFLARAEKRHHQHVRDGAIADATEAIRLDERLARAYALRGHVYAEQGDADAAIADCTRALELAPGLVDTLADRAGARMKTGDDDGAIADSTKAIALDPSIAYPWFVRGAARARRGQVPEAIDDLGHVIEIEPKSPRGYAARGAVRRDGGDLAGAILDYESALRVSPGDAKLEKTLADLKARR
jgi:tetratricopeptide (TPR) repeat protein